MRQDQRKGRLWEEPSIEIDWEYKESEILLLVSVFWCLKISILLGSRAKEREDAKSNLPNDLLKCS